MIEGHCSNPRPGSYAVGDELVVVMPVAWMGFGGVVVLCGGVPYPAPELVVVGDAE
jgi:hypothetical protein